MDPTSIPPPASITAVPPFPAEPNNPKHPPYDEMIYTAIGALKEKDGSSKRAIGKYIEQVYKDLPPTHSALLTHHLTRLKSAGHLEMVKKSYKLRGSEVPAYVSVSLPVPVPVSSTQRSRGRPPKPKPDQPINLSDNPVKRTPGRPKKLTPTVPVPVGLSPKVPGRRGRPPGSTRSKLPKRVGRPPKPKSVSAISSGLKRRPGRPPKTQSNLTVIPFEAPVAPGLPTVPQPPLAAASLPNGLPRPRGRPRKGVPSPAPGILGVAPRGRPRGRPRGVLPVVRPGRPPKLAVGRPKNPAARPVGRPKGATSSAIKAHKAANEDLRKKLEHFQSKVKESLGVLKPYFNHESPVTAIAAIQDLEVLATFDLKAPLRDETQQLPTEQPLQPQPIQPFEQQYTQIIPEPQPELQQFFQPQS